MNPFEPVLATAVALVVLATAVIAVPPNPRPKPEPITEQQSAAQDLKRCEANPERMCVMTQKVEPLPPEVVEQKKVEQIAKDIDATQRDLVEIKEIIRRQQLERDIKNMPNE